MTALEKQASKLIAVEERISAIDPFDGSAESEKLSSLIEEQGLRQFLFSRACEIEGVTEGEIFQLVV